MKRLEEIVERLIWCTASKDPDGEYWGHDTNCGKLTEAKEEARLSIISLFKELIPEAKEIPQYLNVLSPDWAELNAWNSCRNQMIKNIEEL